MRELDLSRVASQTEGYVVRDLEQVVDRALHARRMARNNTGKTIIFITLIRTIMIPHKEGWSVSKLWREHRAGNQGVSEFKCTGELCFLEFGHHRYIPLP